MDTPIKGFLKFFSVRFDGSDFGNPEQANMNTMNHCYPHLCCIRLRASAAERAFLAG